MKTNTLFACLILMLSTYDAGAAAEPQDTHRAFPCCCLRKSRQPQQDIPPQLPAAIIAPAAPQPAAATTDPQTPAPTPEEIAAQKRVAGASTIDSWVGAGWSNWLPDTTLTGIGGLSLTAQQQREAAAASIAARTAQLTQKAAEQGEKIVASALPVAEALGTKFFNTVAPKAQASVELLADQVGQQTAAWVKNFSNSLLATLPKQKTTYQRFCDDIMPNILVYGAALGGTAVAGRWIYYWFMGPQKTE